MRDIRNGTFFNITMPCLLLCWGADVRVCRCDTGGITPRDYAREVCQNGMVSSLQLFGNITWELPSGNCLGKCSCES